MPEDLRKPGIEISGPCSITSMFINALNPGPEGERAEGDLDDDEDSGGHRLIDTVRSAHNRVAAVQRELYFRDAERNREYQIAAGRAAVLHAPRARPAPATSPTSPSTAQPVNAAILGTALTLFHAGRAQAERGQGIYFYLPKLESAAEARVYRDLFDASRARLPWLRDATIRAIVLVESLPVRLRDGGDALRARPLRGGPERRALGPQGQHLRVRHGRSRSRCGPTASASTSRPRRSSPTSSAASSPICLKRGAVPIGGMATALPSPDPEVNRAAAESIREDKEWEAAQGFIRAWVAHIFHMKTAADPFKQLIASGWKPTPEMADPDNYPVRIEVPAGPITVEGTRRNARMLIEYVEGWLNGRGAKGIDSLAGKPGMHPALMEDLATGRMSVAQIAQRIRHAARDHRGPGRRPRLRAGQAAARRGAGRHPGQPRRPGRRRAGASATARRVRIAMRWIKNYTDLDFRSLGSYTRADLERSPPPPTRSDCMGGHEMAPHTPRRLGMPRRSRGAPRSRSRYSRATKTRPYPRGDSGRPGVA